MSAAESRRETKGRNAMRLMNVARAVGVLVALPAVGVHAAVLIVSPFGNDAGGCGTQFNPCATIQFATNAAAPGSTIKVEGPGNFDGVNVTDPMTFEFAPLANIVNPGQPCVNISGLGGNDTVRILNLFCDQDGANFAGVRVTGRGNLEIVNSNIIGSNTANVDIQSSGTFFGMFDRMNVINGKHGFRFAPKKGTARVQITNSNITRNETGILFQSDADSNLSGLLRGINAFGSFGDGVRIEGTNTQVGITDSTFNFNTLQGINRVTGTWRVGADVFEIGNGAPSDANNGPMGSP
jgi:hypothetical protein